MKPPAKIALIAAACASLCVASETDAHPKAPFKILYNSDLTHIKACESPYRKDAEEFSIDRLKASIDEAANAGVDGHLLSPLMMYVPAWKSKIYPIEEHVAWLKSQWPEAKITDYIRVLSEGADIIDEYVRHCRAKKIAPLLTLRMSDYHGQEYADAGPGTKLDWFFICTLDKWRAMHPEYRVAPLDEQQELEMLLTNPDRRDDLRKHSIRLGYSATDRLREQRVMNWRHPAVRERMLGFIKELCAYDIAGLELDFMRHYAVFDDKLPVPERRTIINAFVRDVRKRLDESSKPNEHRWLIVRVPAYLSCCDNNGLDYQQMATAGVDIFNLSANYYTVQQTDFATIRKLLPSHKAVYLEMTHCAAKDQDLARNGENSFHAFRFTTPHQLLTTANLARQRGLSGASLFNFQYYREYADRRWGPFQEPPFDAVRQIAAGALDKLPQVYFVGNSRNNRLPGYKAVLPQILLPGAKVQILMDAAPPKRSLSTNCRLRLQFKRPLSTQQFEVWFNGRKMPSCDDTSEPFGGYNPVLTGLPETLRAVGVPSDLILDGVNSIDIVQTAGHETELVFVELEIR